MQVNRGSLREGKGTCLCLLYTHALVWPISKAFGLGALHSHVDQAAAGMDLPLAAPLGMGHVQECQ